MSSVNHNQLSRAEISNPWFVRRQECPACASGHFRTIYQSQYDRPPIKDYLVDFYSPQGMVEFEYLEGATYILCECDACGLIFQRDIPNKSLMERLYEHWIDPQKAFSQHQEQDCLRYYSYYAQEIMQIIAYLGKDPSSLSLLDFGMGWGKWAGMAKAFGCDSFGVELSAERIQYAKLNGIKVINWDEIPQYRFDFINTEQVFEHVSEPLQTLRHLSSGLKRDGILKISVPTAHDIERRLKIMDWQSPKGSRNSLNPVAPLEHINFFRRRSLAKMAVQAGLEELLIPIKVQYQYVTDWRGAKKIAKNILLPLYRNILKKENYIFLRKVQPTGN
jgi:2-polyprenyl-3-methyl-5-hydroxy-6-metoxy-1,4-benzoquinol methylase